MEFFLKQHSYNSVVLQNYNDYSRKVVFQRKYNQKAVLAKACPTSKAGVKFLLNTQLELDVAMIPLLINVLRTQVSSGPEREVFIVVGTSTNWKKEEERVVLRSGGYGAKEILLQKKKTVLPDEDMMVSDDAPPMEIPHKKISDDEWVDEYGSFYIKKTDDVGEILKGLNFFYSNTQPQRVVAGKKIKQTKKINKEEEIGGKKTKSKNNKFLVEEDESIEESVEEPIEELILECEFQNNESNIKYIELLNNEKALIELAYFYEMSNLSLEDCILCYHDEISINTGNEIDFFNLLSDIVSVKKIESVLNKIIKKKNFFFRMVKKKLFHKVLLKKQQDC